MITWGVMIWRLMIWMLHVSYSEPKREIVGKGKVF